MMLSFSFRHCEVGVLSTEAISRREWDCFAASVSIRNKCYSTIGGSQWRIIV